MQTKEEGDLTSTPAWLLALAEHNADSIALLARDSTHLYVNPAQARAAGLPREAMIGKKNQDLGLPAELAQRLDVMRETVFETGQSLLDEFAFESPTGWHYYQAQLIPDKDEHGEVQHIVSILHEITPQKLLEAQNLANSQSALVMAQTIARMGSWELDFSTNEIIFSDGLYHLIGLEPGSIALSMEKVFSFLHPDDVAQAREALERSLKGQPKQHLHLRVIRADGEVRWIRMVDAIERDEAGTPIKQRGVAMDITVVKQAEALQHKLALERERMSLVEAFIRDVSHEIRTPLTIINNNASLMARTDDAELRRDRASKIQKEVANITRLVENMITMIYVEKCDGSQHTPVQIGMVYDAAVETVLARYPDHAELIYLPTPNLPTVEGDYPYLLETFMQLLDNAFRFTPPGGQVTVRTGFDGSFVHFSVEDTGIGISEAQMPYIFDRFWRADNAHTTRGLGLGLSLSKQIIDHLNGSIHVSSEPGQGTRVDVSLPILWDKLLLRAHAGR